MKQTQLLLVTLSLMFGFGLVLMPDTVADAASRVKVFAGNNHGHRSVVAAPRTGNVVATSSIRIRSEDDLRRLSDSCGPLYQMDLVCGGQVAVKAPPGAVACGPAEVQDGKSVLRFSDGSKLTAKKRVHSDGSESVRLDHDKD